ncbi:HPr kinase/phosphatase C-terminal domain-containing protein [Sphingobium sp.]|uniref:HPr kinase/phosphorylase n=1 Tax=Sphingobium sp. TaxID=1912891 RepID=UPI002C37BC77|nr:HPr kinase/phosphatase C-terminal domain-containing protein [Sphingobium sp.]HUD94887.1 HPr kinase/phosphatase C-terminal domain-containing protein [Sphingobium sp.]
MNAASIAYQATGVAIGGRGVLIRGAPGVGKSSLALSLIDRGAVLIGDDSMMLKPAEGRLLALPHPNTLGILEVRNLGLLPFPCVDTASVALVVDLVASADRYIEGPETIAICGVELPRIALWPEAVTLAIKTEMALRHYGLSQ